MTNLLKETKLLLKNHGKTMADIVAVGGNDFQMPVEDFIRLADKEYDDSYGVTKVAGDLILLGNDFWLERHEYDGSEWWEYKTLPVWIKDLPVNNNVESLYGWWDTLSEIEEREKQKHDKT